MKKSNLDIIRKMILYPQPKEVIYAGGQCKSDRPVEEIEEKDFAEEAYQIEILSDKIVLQYGKNGRQSALSCLEQIKIQSKEFYPTLVIKDCPDFTNRGFMLDVSRDRVPNRSTLERLVYILWLFRYNQLQLYTEHTFAYKKHEQVWKDASPLTAEDYIWLDQLCLSRGIELVPNQNTFGHFERWLKHPDYHHLAECPNGFIHPKGGFREFGSVLKPNDESVQFVDQLLGEFLPNFTSKQVNIGCDETWELGQGWSKEIVETNGKFNVYLEHVEKLISLAEKHGKKPQVWADILLSNPNEISDHLKGRFIPMIWGYEADHPFDIECEKISKITTNYYVVPGTSCWNSFTGRWRNAKANIENASKAARKHGASGFLLTSWGDNGHHYPFSMMLPSILFAADKFWSESASGDLFEALDVLLVKDSQSIAVFQSLLSSVEKWGKDPFNNSLHFILSKASAKTLANDTELTKAIKIEKLKDEIAELRNQLPMGENEFAKSLCEDLLLVILLLNATLDRIRSIRSGKDDNYDILETISDLFEQNWKTTSKVGGLIESLNQFSKSS